MKRAEALGLAALKRSAKMTRVIALLATLFSLALLSCVEEDAVVQDRGGTIKGFPVYQFLNFGAINERQLLDNEKEAKEALGENFDDYISHHKSMVAAGFDLHMPLRIIVDDGHELEVFVRDKDYRTLWETSPHDLHDKGKRHFITLDYDEILVDGRFVKRGVVSTIELRDGIPEIRK